MGEWKETRLGEMATFQRGYDITRKSMTLGKYPVISSSGLCGYHNQFITKGPGVIIGRKGTLGTVFYIEAEYWPHDTTLWVKDFHGNHPKYIYYFMKSFGVIHLDVGSANPTLNRNHIHPIKVRVPSLDEQKAIASVLSSLDDKIDLLERQNRTLEALAETLFRQWFVEEAEEGWETVKLGNLISVKGGTTPSTQNPEFWNGNIYWTSPRDLSNFKSVFLLDTKKKITEKGLAKIGSGLLPVGTVLLSSRAPIGYLAVTDIPVAINQGYIAIICDKLISNFFIYVWLKLNMEVIINAANGSTFLEISKSTFKELEIEVPPETKLDKFNSIAKSLFDKIKSNTYQIRTLFTLRDTILPKLISGQIRVKDVEKVL